MREKFDKLDFAEFKTAILQDMIKKMKKKNGFEYPVRIEI